MSERKGDGSRSVDLLIPFTTPTGERVEAITFRPFLYDDFVRFHSGKFTGINDVLCDIAEKDMTVLGQLRYPDADIVLQEFLAHMPPSIREQLVSGEFPKAEEPQAPGDNGLSGSSDWDDPGLPQPGPLDDPQDFGGVGIDIGDGKQ